MLRLALTNIQLAAFPTIARNNVIMDSSNTKKFAILHVIRGFMLIILQGCVYLSVLMILSHMLIQSIINVFSCVQMIIMHMLRIEHVKQNVPKASLNN